MSRAEDFRRDTPPRRVVIVDDSRTLRQWLRVTLEQDPGLVVVGEAEDATQARQVIRETAPDLVTLDIQMPGMSGLDFLEKIMALRPTPVVMISSATARGSEAAIRALSLGAVDCILKPGPEDYRDRGRAILHRVRAAAHSRPQPRRPAAPARVQPRAGGWDRDPPLVLIGASTGGVNALETVLADLDPGGPPVVIVQHMPEAFLARFAEVLDRSLPQRTRLLTDGVPLKAGEVWLAPANHHHSVIARRAGGWIGHLRAEVGRALHCPSVDHLFVSAVPHASRVVAVLLTGLGRDGAAGMLALAGAGAQTIAQDEETSVVYGMPRAAWESGAAQVQLPLEEIGEAVNRAVTRCDRPRDRVAP